MSGPIRISILADARNAIRGFRQTSNAASKMGTDLRRSGVKAGAGFAGGITDSLASIAPTMKGAMIVAGTGAAVVAGPLIGASLGAGILGGIGLAGIGAGIAGVIDNPAVKAATDSLGAKLKTAFNEMTMPFEKPVLKSIDMVSASFDKLRPQLDSIFKNLAPMVEPLTKGLLGGVEGLVGGLSAAAKVAGPFVKIIADGVKMMGERVGQGIKDLAGDPKALEGMKAALNDVFSIIGFTIDKTFEWIGAMSRLYGTLKELWATHAPAIKSAFTGVDSTVTGVFGKLKSAWDTFSSSVASPELSAAVDNIKTQFSGIVDAIKERINVVKPIIGDVVNTITTKFNELLPRIRPIFANIATIFAQVLETIKVAIQMGTAVISFIWTNFGTHIKDFIRSTMDNVVTIFSGVFEVIKGVFEVVLGVLTGDWSRAWEGVKTVLAGAFGVIKAIFAQIGAAATLFGNVVKIVITAAWNSVRSTTSSVWGSVKGFLSSAWSSIKSSVSSAVNSVKSAISNAWNSVRSSTSNAWNSVKSTISSGVSSAISSVRNMASNIVSAVSGLAGRMVSAGRNAISGFISGMAGMLGSVVSKAREIASSALNAAKSALGIASPSKQFKALGRWVGLGFIQGLTATESKIISSVKSLSSKIVSAFPDGTRLTGTQNRLIKMVQTQGSKLTGLAKRRDGIAKQIADANKRMVDLSKSRAEIVTNIADTIRGSFKLVTDGASSLTSVLARSTRAVVDAQRFTENLMTLRKRGLDANLLQELAAGGVTSGGATTRSLMNATDAQIRLLNSNFTTLNKISTSTGNVIGNAMYDAGVKATHGLVAGLVSNRKTIENTMLDIAKGMQKAIRRALGIKSPSVVMFKLGEQTIRGFADGFCSITGEQMGRTLTASLSNINPAIGSYSYASPTAAKNVQPVVIHFNGIVGDPAEVGRQVNRALAAYSTTYGR